MFPSTSNTKMCAAPGTTWLSATVAIIGTGPSGRPQYSFIAEDISERELTEAALRESEARLQAIANLVPDLLWSSGAVGSTDWYNQRWLEYSGQTAEQALGDGWLRPFIPRTVKRRSSASAPPPHAASPCATSTASAAPPANIAGT